jgi:Ion channel
MTLRESDSCNRSKTDEVQVVGDHSSAKNRDPARSTEELSRLGENKPDHLSDNDSDVDVPDQNCASSEEGRCIESSTSTRQLNQREANGKFRGSISFADDDDDPNVKQKPLDRCFRKYPRSCAIVLTIFIPLWILLLISFLFGFIIAKSEAPYQVESNDAFFASKLLSSSAAQLVTNFSASLPLLCLDLYLEKRPPNENNLNEISGPILSEELLIPSVDEVVGGNQSSEKTGGLVRVYAGDNTTVYWQTPRDIILEGSDFGNATDLYRFLLKCGEASRTVNIKLLDTMKDRLTALASSEGAAKFQWIRCLPQAYGLSNTPSFLTGWSYKEARREAQAELYEQTWKTSQRQLFRQFLNEEIKLQGNLTAESVAAVFGRSLVAATGESTCGLNGPAAAWAFFTVMTTIGYGNMPPETHTGRGIVYSFGFLGILLFGGILANAGRVISTIADDAFRRRQWTHIIRSPWSSSVVWALSYYAWMLVIANSITSWKQSRLGVSWNEFSYADGYWFSYISTSECSTILTAMFCPTNSN